MANITTQTIRVDLSTDKVLPTAFTHQNDTARTLEFSMYNKGMPYTMTGNTVEFAYKSPIVDGAYTVITGSGMASGTVSGNKVTVTLPSTYTAISGVGMLTMIITPTSGTVRPVNIRLVVQKSADGDDVIAGASDFPDAWMDEKVYSWLDGHIDGVFSEEQFTDAVDNWLDDHPEATTTVVDGSITVVKLHENVTNKFTVSKLAEMRSRMGVIAHRGALYNTYPNVGKNTLSAIRWALENNYDGVEVDLQYDEDGNIVCYHDTTLDSDTDQTGYLYNAKYTDVHVASGLDSSAYAENPALLTDVLYYAAKANKFVWLDFKNISGHYVDIETVMGLCKQYGTKYALGITTENIPTAVSVDPNVWVVTNDFNGGTAPTEVQVKSYTDVCQNVIFYMNNTTSGVDAQEVDMLHRNGCLYYSNLPNVYADGVLLSSYPVSGGTPRYDSKWIKPTLQNGATSKSIPYDVYYRRIGDAVYLKGIINPNASALPTTDGTTRITMFTLPVGFRPPKNSRFLLPLNTVPNSAVTVQVSSNGEVRIWSVILDTTLTDLNTGIVLDGVSFVATGYGFVY